uniref:Uncharacterized protein n=1 Tax=Lepeophtheirus salmonis TaxID=72036 RepID=A0A0K2UTF9_LEPSM
MRRRAPTCTDILLGKDEFIVRRRISGCGSINPNAPFQRSIPILMY